MPIERPTFSESWYRVAELRPRLRGSVQIHRQHFRGQMWHVLQDPSNNQFFRLNESAYRFVALLDGRRTISQTWQVCNEQLGDNAPTQGEAIQLLGQLYSSNLLQAELAPDAEGLFNRYHKRVSREVRGYLMNLLFIRIPLLDPDRFLNAWVGIVGRIFTWYGLVLWLILLSIGGYFAITNSGELTSQFSKIFDQQNLATNMVLMYISFAVIKAVHEFGHAFACKKFGVSTGSGGEVHVMGIMFLVLTPIPYVDASSSWAFREKWHRIVVGAAGMIVEMAVAAIAAIVWATVKDPTIHALAYNAMLIGSVTTLVFNANPLLRYDGYYILSDLLEIPNLAQRSKDYIYYLVKKYAWGVKNPRSPAHGAGEKAWFVFYGIASTIYRTIVVVAILFFIAGKLFMVGVILALAASIAWLCVPVGKFIHYLATNGELMRVRGRAVGTVLGFVAVTVGFIGLVPYPDRSRVSGIVEPVDMQTIYASENGFVRDFLPSESLVRANDSVLLDTENPDLSAGLEEARIELEGYRVQQRAYLGKGDTANVNLCENLCLAWGEIVARLQKRVANLRLYAPISGRWVSEKIDRVNGRYLTQQMELGKVISDRKFVSGVIPQDSALRIKDAWDKRELTSVEIRGEGRPDIMLKGRIVLIAEAGSMDLPSKALGYNVGGSVTTDPKDQRGTRTVEPFFTMKIEFDAPDDRIADKLLTGQRVVIRAELPKKPLYEQWLRSLRQLVEKKFGTS